MSKPTPANKRRNPNEERLSLNGYSEVLKVQEQHTEAEHRIRASHLRELTQIGFQVMMFITGLSLTLASLFGALPATTLTMTAAGCLLSASTGMAIFRAFQK